MESENDTVTDIDASMNRKRFLSTAPSMIKLIQYVQQNGKQSTISDDDSPEPIKKGHALKGSVVELIFNTQMSEMIDMQLVAEQAAKEFQDLARQHDDLYHEAQEMKAKYDDLLSDYNSLDSQVMKLDALKEQTEYLMTKNDKFQTEIQRLQSQINGNPTSTNETDTQRFTEEEKNKIIQNLSSSDQESVLWAEYIKTFENQRNVIEKLRANNKDFGIETMQTKSHPIDPKLSGLIEEDNEVEETALIEQLKSEITVLKNKMSHMEDDTEDSVQKILDLADIGRNNNDLLKEELESDEYEYVEEEIEVEITDEDVDTSILHADDLVTELETKENELRAMEQQVIVWHS